MFQRGKNECFAKGNANTLRRGGIYGGWSIARKQRRPTLSASRCGISDQALRLRIVVEATDGSGGWEAAKKYKNVSV